jgi:hypothetical protein
MARPRKGDTTPRQGKTANTADHAHGRRKAGESRREQLEREKAENAGESPWVVGPRLINRSKTGRLSHKKLEELATQVAKGGISAVDCSIDLFTLQMQVEGARKRGDITDDKYVTARRQLLKLKLDVAQAFADQGPQLPGSINVTLKVDGAESPLPQAGPSGDQLAVH